MTRILRLATLVLALAIVSLSLVPAGESTGFTLLPAQTRVGVAKVKLLVSNLEYDGDDVVGTYRITIPLAPWRNDRGDVRFDLEEPFEQTLATGGVVTGAVHSLENGRVHPITCKFEADGTVFMTVETHERILRFTSRMAGVS